MIAGIIIAVFAFTINPAALLVAAVFEGISEAAFSASSGALLSRTRRTQKIETAFFHFTDLQIAWHSELEV